MGGQGGFGSANYSATSLCRFKLIVHVLMCCINVCVYMCPYSCKQVKDDESRL